MICKCNRVTRLWSTIWIILLYILIVTFVTLITFDRDDRDHFRNRANTRQSSTIKIRTRSTRHSKPNRHSKLPWCKPLRYQNPPGPSTALVSFPGSGNTWLRYLLQQSTGILTGSVYKDYALLKNGFPAETVANGSVLVVKTHEFGPQIRSQFSRAILLVRNPIPSIQAEFNRQSGGHVGHAPSVKYKKDNGEFWRKFSHIKGISWMNTTIDWLQFEGPLHLLIYEDLEKDLSAEMKKVLSFLDVYVSDSDFECMIRNKDGIYKRRKKPLGFEPFTPPIKEWLLNCQSIVNKSIKEYNEKNNNTFR